MSKKTRKKKRERKRNRREKKRRRTSNQTVYLVLRNRGEFVRRKWAELYENFNDTDVKPLQPEVQASGENARFLARFFLWIALIRLREPIREKENRVRVPSNATPVFRLVSLGDNASIITYDLDSSFESGHLSRIAHSNSSLSSLLIASSVLARTPTTASYAASR